MPRHSKCIEALRLYTSFSASNELAPLLQTTQSNNKYSLWNMNDEVFESTAWATQPQTRSYRCSVTSTACLLWQSTKFSTWSRVTPTPCSRTTKQLTEKQSHWEDSGGYHRNHPECSSGAFSSSTRQTMCQATKGDTRPVHKSSLLCRRVLGRCWEIWVGCEEKLPQQPWKRSPERQEGINTHPWRAAKLGTTKSVTKAWHYC